MTNLVTIYKNFIRLLEEKAAITLGETQHIYRTVAYVLEKEKTEIDNSQFVKDCKTIKSALLLLNEKIDNYKYDLKKLEENITAIAETQLQTSNNLHLEYILKLDCMQNRSFSISEKLEYLYRAYENLIAQYNSQYLPMPSISKRMKTSNLMLFFNQELNEAQGILLKNFFLLDEKEKDNIFSTWVFSGYEHIKEIDYRDDTNNTFISLSFWFYEKQIFYPIAFHEIVHSIYMNRNHHDKIKKIKLSHTEKENIANKLLLSPNSTFSSSMLYIIYQDIVADFCAYALSGDSYIFAFFFTGFMQNIHKNFYLDVQVGSAKEQKYPKEEDIRCLNQHDNLTLLEWSSLTSRKEDNFMSFYVRLKLLLELRKRVKKSSAFDNEIEGIKDILNLIYPDSSFKKSYNTFENIFTSFQKQNNQYKYEKHFVQLLTSLFSETVFSQKKLHKKVKDTLSVSNKLFKKNKGFFNCIEHNYSSNNKYYNNLSTQYDLYWKQRFNQVNTDNNSLGLGRLLRLYNLTKLGIINSTKNGLNLDTRIYELVFFKFYNKSKNPFIEYFEENSNYLSTDKLNNGQVSYAFGPYDIALLSQNTTAEIDNYLNKLSQDKKNFFTERHALFLLDKIPSKSSTHVGMSEYQVDLVISIDAKDELSKNTVVLYRNLSNSLSNCQFFEQAKIFASMGNESFIIFIQNISFNDINKFSDRIYEIEKIKNISTTVLIKEKATFSNIKVENRSIILLCKLKKSTSYKNTYDNIKKNISKIENSHKYKLYKKYGTYDLIITFENDTTMEDIKYLIDQIQDNVSDIQLELQSLQDLDTQV
jgi:hypothetical protein